MCRWCQASGAGHRHGRTAALRAGGRTTCGRVQSLAFTAKAAEAQAVVAVVLGRRVNPRWAPSAPLLERLRAESWLLLVNGLKVLVSLCPPAGCIPNRLSGDAGTPSNPVSR